MIAAALAFGLLLSGSLQPISQQGEDYLPWLLERLESPDPEVRASSFHALLSEKDAAAACLVEFSSASALAREIRSRVLLERGGEAQVDAALSLLRLDPDLEVRSQLLRFIGRADLEAKSAPARCAAAGELGQEDGAIAETAVEVLQRLEYPCASESLLRVVRRHPSRERRESALKALLRRWVGGGELLDLANAPGPDRAFLVPVLLALGDRAEPRAMPALLRHWDDTDARLRAAARQAFSNLQARRALRGDANEAIRDFRALREALGVRPEILLEEGHFALLHVPDAAEAKDLALEAIPLFAKKSDREEAVQRARSFFLLAAAHLLRREPVDADRAAGLGLKSLEEVLRCVDDFEEPDQGYAASILMGKGWTLRALNAMTAKADGLPSVGSCWESAYRASQDAQRYRDDWLSQLRKKTGSWPYNMDEIFGGELGLYSLLEGPLPRDWGKEKAEAVWRDVAGRLSRLDAIEFPPVIEDIEVKQPAAGDGAKRLPSDFPVRLADFFESSLGKSEIAISIYRKLGEAWRLRLNDFPGFAQDVARVEARIGSLCMDRREGDAAEQAIRRALGLLEDLSALLQARSGDATPDAQLQAQMAAAFVSLAVNENVVKGRPEAARAHLEKAYALDPSPFNRVLFACYEARAGRAEAARRVLDQVDPEPALFYNVACTFALLGEKEKSLSFLEKHFRIALRGAGERRRGAEWARKDPDLEALRGVGRFESLLREAAAELSGPK